MAREPLGPYIEPDSPEWRRRVAELELEKLIVDIEKVRAEARKLTTEATIEPWKIVATLLAALIAGTATIIGAAFALLKLTQ